jgi:hypothetical protein
MGICIVRKLHEPPIILYGEKSEKNMWKTITWEICGKTAKKIVWKNMWKRIAWEKHVK